METKEGEYAEFIIPLPSKNTQQPYDILVVETKKKISIPFEQRFRKEIRNNEIKCAFAFWCEEGIDYSSSNNHGRLSSQIS